MDISFDVTLYHLETSRLILRPFRKEDVHDFFAYASVPGVGEMAGWPHHENLETSQRILESFLKEKNVFALVLKETGRVVGSLGLHPSWMNEDRRYSALSCKEIGYVLSKSHWGQGLMPEAVREVTRFCFEELKLEALSVGHFISNSQSRRVIEKCGFRFDSQGVFNARQLNKTFQDYRYILINPALSLREGHCKEEQRMIRFNCDYAEGAHPRILSRLQETNFVQTPGYGEDEFCAAAAQRLRDLCQAPDAAVHFLVGGTQTNLIVLAAALRPYQGVIAADTGHINVHETGAIEAGGHKVLAISGKNGLLCAEDVEEYCRLHEQDEAHEHMVQPGAVYISQSTELGTCYTKKELLALRAVCDRHGLILFLDGARLGYAMAAPGNDVDLPFLYQVCDVFYLGGTKQGALFGEAVVIRNPLLKKDFRYLIKQRGAMLAKGRLLGLQFDTLLEDGLYFRLAEHAVAQALRIKSAFLKKGFPILVDSPTNQQFPILPDVLLDSLRKKYTFTYQQRMDEHHSAVRFCTSWATRAEDVDALISDILLLPTV